MKLSRILVCSLLLSTAHHVFAFTWPNEPAGSDLVLDCPFTGQLCASMWNTYGNQPFTNITLPGVQPASPSGVLDYNLPVGATSGGGQFGVALPKVREVYMATWWATNAGAEWNRNNGNKILFISGADGIENNLLLWQGDPTGPKKLVWYPQSESNNCHVSGWQGGCGSPGVAASGWFNPNGPHNGYVEAGSGWHLIEIYKKASTTSTSRDGIVRIWIDGQLSTNYTNINESPNGFNDVQYNSTWGGFACDANPDPSVPTAWHRDCTKERHHYYDHLRVSVPHGAGTITMPLAITSSLPAMQEGRFYSTTFGAANGKAPYGWTISAGSLPPGLTLNKTTGVLSGTPSTIGRSDFTVKVMDSSVPAGEATKAFTVIVSRSTGIGKRELTVNGSQLAAEPGKARVTFRMTYDGMHSLSVYDLSGREVWRHAGSGEAVWNHGGNLKKGVYLVRAEQNGKALKSNYCHVW